MADELQIRCLRCGADMLLRDPAPGAPWQPVQYWECPRCSRHFWTTYPPPKPKAGEPAAEPVAAEAKP